MSGGGSNGALSNVSSCGSSEVLLFALAVFFGTFTSICSKTMMSMSGTNGGTSTIDGTAAIEPFSKPLFQTFGMFVGMTFGLVMHAFVAKFGVPFPGYDHRRRRVAPGGGDGRPGGGAVASSTMALTPIAGATTTEGTPLVSASASSAADGEVSFGSDCYYDGTSPPPPAAMAEIPTSMYLLLAIPALFDLGATALW